MDGVKILDTGSNLLVSCPSEELVFAVLREMISRGASIVAKPSRLGSIWTGSCTKPSGFQVDTLPTTYSVGEASRTAMLQSVKTTDAGNFLVISGKTSQAVQTALDDLKLQGARGFSNVERQGDLWVASCENPKVNASQCRVDSFGQQLMIAGPTKSAVEGKVREMSESGAKLVTPIEQTPSGDWVAVCDLSGPRTW